MPQDLRDLAHGIARWVTHSEVPPQAPARFRRFYGPNLEGLDGGSANWGWLGHCIGYIRSEANSRSYLRVRLRDELQSGLGGSEQLTPSYGSHHLGPVLIVWWTAWIRGDEEVGRLAGAWIERWLLVQCLCGYVDSDGILQFLAPGMRSDGSAGRWDEEAIASDLLVLYHPAKVPQEGQRPWAVGSLLQAVREAPEIQRVADRVRGRCLELLKSKLGVTYRVTGGALLRTALHIPMRVEVYGPQEWLAWMELGGNHWTGHSQDPAAAWGGRLGGETFVGLPYEEGEDPPEGGWWCRVRDLGDVLRAEWRRKGQFFEEADLRLPPAPMRASAHVLILSAPQDPLRNLPTLPPGAPDRPESEPGEGQEEEEEVPGRPESPRVPIRSLVKQDIRAVPAVHVASLLKAVSALAYGEGTVERVRRNWRERVEPEIVRRREKLEEKP